jgi:formyltetrahydrofolate synthetase
MGILKKLELMNRYHQTNYHYKFSKKLFYKIHQVHQPNYGGKKLEKRKKGAKKLTKEETLDFFDECNKKSHIATKKNSKNSKENLKPGKKTTTTNM